MATKQKGTPTKSAASRKNVTQKARKKIPALKKTAPVSRKTTGKKVPKSAKIAKQPRAAKAAPRKSATAAPVRKGASVASKRTHARNASNVVETGITPSARLVKAHKRLPASNKARPTPAEVSREATVATVKAKRSTSPAASKKLAAQHMREALARKKELSAQPAPWQLIPHRHEPSEKLADGVPPTPVLVPPAGDHDPHDRNSD
jgi:hypothetical protein